MNIKTRIAPSPTGEYHIGNMRTALYDYALAKKHDGKFLLRIEDTDRNRYVEDAPEKIMQVIKDYGLSWDEGPEVGGENGPYIQSERLDIYKKYALDLIENKKAYYCFCTPQRLEELRTSQQDAKLPVTKYDRHCLGLSESEINQRLSNGESYTIRLRVPDDETISFHDEILGDLSFNSKDIDDQVLLKSDGFPTYHLAVVVDDYLMKVTHILRGVDWLSSTPKHIILYKAFGWELPKYAHLPNLKEMGSNKKLSKRSGSVSAEDFLRDGYLPEALLNFLMFLGWNPGTEKEIYSLEEFVEDFSLERVQKTDLVTFDRTKLLWINGHYIRNIPLENLYEKLISWSNKYKVDLVSGDLGLNKDINMKILSLVQERLKTLSEYNDLVSYFYVRPDFSSIKEDFIFSYVNNKERGISILQSFYDNLSMVDESKWYSENLDSLCHNILSDNEYKPKEAFMTLRIALTGRDASPHVFDVLAVLGKKESLFRLDALIKLYS